jgi:hypothetical protein
MRQGDAPGTCGIKEDPMPQRNCTNTDQESILPMEDQTLLVEKCAELNYAL